MVAALDMPRYFRYNAIRMCKPFCGSHTLLSLCFLYHSLDFTQNLKNYHYLNFYSFDDLQVQMKRYLYRSNNIPMAVLGWKSPNQKQRELGGCWTAAKWDSFSRRYAPRSFIPFCILLDFSYFLFFYFFSLTSLTNVQA